MTEVEKQLQVWDFGSQEPAFLFECCGPPPFWAEAIIPFVKDSDAVLKKIGFVDSVRGFTRPGALIPRRGGGIALDLGATGALIGLIIFLGSSVGSWAVGKTCDALFETKIHPVLKRLSERIRASRTRKQSIGSSFHFRCSTWYEQDQLLVQVDVEITDPAQLSNIGRYLVLAQQRAASQANQHTGGPRLVAYRVEEGKLLGPDDDACLDD